MSPPQLSVGVKDGPPAKETVPAAKAECAGGSIGAAGRCKRRGDVAALNRRHGTGSGLLAPESRGFPVRGGNQNQRPFKLFRQGLMMNIRQYLLLGDFQNKGQMSVLFISGEAESCLQLCKPFRVCHINPPA